MKLLQGNGVTVVETDLSVALSPANPVIPDANSWATPLFGIVYLVLVVIALASLTASKWISTPVKVVVAVAILALPLVGAIAWVAYSLVRQRLTRNKYENS
ncbi:hypothetical protein [Arthrobacter bambusae]|uniref:hypothetical protein n=1 Tax=Arthrobacter bambusae TaxID=1338426 RepID=UPI00278202FC|nr:hypothetical protein [Arthrobacter bambusae]MDQ0029688.1 Na+/phosphate symporter [Arthrobacter bambusae]MDQ0097349.1 Na+/phosphate symporter [Arthrobacter bambusae]